MPVFDTAAHVWRSPSYRQGKAIELANVNKQLVNQQLEQEIEMAPEAFEQEKRQLDIREDEYELAFDKFQAETNEATRARAKDAAVAALQGLQDGEDATEIFASILGEDIPEGFEFTESFGKRLLASGEKYQEVQAANAKLVADTKFIDGLNISDKEKDRLKLQVAERMGAGAASTFDPRSPKTESQQGKNVVDFEDATIGAIGAVETGTELLKIALADPAALGKPGAIAKFGNEMLVTAIAIGEIAGIKNLDPKRDLGKFKFDSFDAGPMKKIAVESTQFRAGVYGIAFAAAVAEQGIRPTDKDIQQFIMQIGGNSSDPIAFTKTISQFMARQDRRLKAIATVKDIPQRDVDRAMGGWNKAYGVFKEVAGQGGSQEGGELTPEEQAELDYYRSLE
jgi:hypothetical protein